LNKEDKVKLIMLKREKKIRQVKDDFWEFCKLMSPTLPISPNPKYTKQEKLYQEENRDYLKELAKTLQGIYERNVLKEDGTPYKHVMISMPPRHGKSYTVQLFELWVLGKDPSERIATVSYSSDFAEDFSEFLRDKIQESREENDLTTFVFNDIFPDVKLKQSAKAKKKWSLEGYHSSYKGVGFDGGITGKGYTLMVIDDPHKDSEEAYNNDLLDKKYKKYTGTFKNRLDGDGMRIIIQTRWSCDDIIGRISDAEEGKHYYKIVQKAFMNEDKVSSGLEAPKMLCDYILHYEEYQERKSDDDEMIFLANNQQELIDKKGALYQNLKHWDKLPTDNNGNSLFEDIVAYIDTADKGEDYLAGVIAGKYQGYLYVLDIIYTQANMEITEGLLTEALIRNNVNHCIIESNNGGSIFARNIRKMLWDKYKSRKPTIQDVAQTKNKETRILSNAHLITNNVFFMPDAKIKYSEAWKSIIMFKKEGKNKHDDIEDALTGLWEKFGEGNGRRITSPISKRALGL